MSKKMVLLALPWTDEHGHRQITRMTLASDELPDRRMAFRMVRNFYKHNIGRSVTKQVIEIIWKARVVTRSMTEEDINIKLNEMAHETYLAVTNPDYEENAADEAGE